MVDHCGHAAVTARSNLAGSWRGGAASPRRHESCGTSPDSTPGRLRVVRMKQIAARGMRWSVPGLRQRRQARGASRDESGEVHHIRDHHHFSRF